MPTSDAAAHPSRGTPERSDPPHGRRDGPLLDDGLLDFMQSGLCIIVGTVAPDGLPVPGLGHGCAAGPDGSIRVSVGRKTCARFLAAVAAGQPVAVTFTRAADHRSIQIKSRQARILAPMPSDLENARRQASVFANALVDFQYTRAFSDAFASFDPAELAVVEFTPDRAFLQTPGPGAGGALAP